MPDGADLVERSDLADREWRLIREEALAGPIAMAYDEISAETAARGGPRTVRVYRWRPGTLSLGYRQDPDTVDWDYCRNRGIGVTRRPSGGGGIYHDAWGDISYSIVAPAEELPGDLLTCYSLLCEPILAALRALGVDADYAETEQPALYEPSCYLRGVDPAHDVVAGDGRKVSGNAQYRQRDAVVQHGSITFETTPETSLGCFRDPGLTPQQFRDRVTSIRERGAVPAEPDRGEPPPGRQPGRDEPPPGRQPGRDEARDRVVRTLEESLASWADASDGAWTAGERERAAELAEAKYATAAWTRDRADPTA